MVLQFSGCRLCSAPRHGGQMHIPGKAPGPWPRCTMGRSQCVLGLVGGWVGGWGREGRLHLPPVSLHELEWVLWGRQEKYRSETFRFSLRENELHCDRSVFPFLFSQAWSSLSENEAGVRNSRRTENKQELKSAAVKHLKRNSSFSFLFFLRDVMQTDCILHE